VTVASANRWLDSEAHSFHRFSCMMAHLQTTMQLVELLLSQTGPERTRFAVPSSSVVPHNTQRNTCNDAFPMQSAMRAQAIMALSDPSLLPLSTFTMQASAPSMPLPMLPPPDFSSLFSQRASLTHNKPPGHRLPIASSRRRPLSEAEETVLLVKIIMKCVDKAGDHTLKNQVKSIVADCTRRNRMGDPAYTPLRDACKVRLRRTVGELHWSRVQLLYNRYCIRQGIHCQANSKA
jgi:hypothetical protein